MLAVCKSNGSKIIATTVPFEIVVVSGGCSSIVVDVVTATITTVAIAAKVVSLFCC